ncbi:MAG: glycosyltransferase [Chloroflexi bacterium]|nr:MAG: glycosyltransferase [Chloroflexota bacterium]
MSMSSRIEIPIVSTKRSLAKLFAQVLRFCLVGGLNTFVDVLVFNLLVLGLPTQDNGLLVIYNSLAYLVGAVNSFCWNKLWTFQQRSSTTNSQLARFALVTSLGILCNDAFLWLATTLLTSFSLTSFLWVNVAKVSAIAGSVSVSYLGMRYSVFTKNNEVDLALPPSNPRLIMSPRSLSVILPAYNEEALIGQTLFTVMSALTSWMQDFEVIVVNDGSKDHTADIVARLAAHDQRIHLINHPVNKGYGAALVTGFESVTKELAFFMDADGQFETRGAMINAEIIYKLARSGYTYTEVGVHHLPRQAGKATGAKPTVILRALRELFIYAEKWRQEEQRSSYGNASHVYKE